MPQLRRRALMPGQKFALHNNTAANARAWEKADDILRLTPRAQPLLAENAEVHVIADNDPDLVFLFKDTLQVRAAQVDIGRDNHLARIVHNTGNSHADTQDIPAHRAAGLEEFLDQEPDDAQHIPGTRARRGWLLVLSRDHARGRHKPPVNLGSAHVDADEIFITLALHNAP